MVSVVAGPGGKPSGLFLEQINLCSRVSLYGSDCIEIAYDVDMKFLVFPPKRSLCPPRLGATVPRGRGGADRTFELTCNEKRTNAMYIHH